MFAATDEFFAGLPAARSAMRALPAAMLLALFAYLFVMNAWVNDDAHTSFRVVDNFVNGRGLRWNPEERVQTYVHPLWIFVLGAASLFTRELYLTSLAVSFACSACALFFIWRRASCMTAVLLGALMLFSSKAFIDFSSSGLENPLSHLLFALFFTSFLHRAPVGCGNADARTFRADARNSGDAARADRRSILLYFLAASLFFLNRYDTILITIPALLYLLHVHRARNGAWAMHRVVLGSAPAIIWIAFALVYYGFLLPNVYHAKMNMVKALPVRITQGLAYFVNAIYYDPATALVIVCGLLRGFGRDRTPREMMTASGMALYLCYTVWIGGCFMTGRFFALPALLSTIIIAQRPRSFAHSGARNDNDIKAAESETKMNAAARKNVMGGFARNNVMHAIALSAALVLCNIINPRSPVRSGRDYHLHGFMQNNHIEDDRAFYHRSASPLFYTRGRAHPRHEWTRIGLKLRESRQRVAVVNNTGFIGYFAGPQKSIIDMHALTDPLLARIPSRCLMPGHCRRALPDGYRESVRDGANCITDPRLAGFYEKIRVITRGDLFTARRWRYIILLNFGGGGHYRRSYEAAADQSSIQDESVKPRGLPWPPAFPRMRMR